MNASVLLIDDDPVDIRAMRLLLESWGLDVTPARSGKDALAILDSAPIDLVVSDVCMPGLSGEDIVRSIARTHPGLPTVLVTGQGDVKSAVRAMKLGAFDYVLKPPDESEFLIILQRALEHSSLRRENQFLRAELAAGGMYGERLIGRSAPMLAVFETINRVAQADSTVLITGETGTGKELVAQTIHFRSRRSDKPLVAFNCASLNPNLVESELFGHEKGAFTGAVASRRGRFEDADGGTLFLDEIGETTPEFQSKLLRVLEEGTFERLGGNRSIRVDVRVLASTNRDLQKEVDARRFREDLYYRLRVIPLRLPSLRERPEDIPLLALHFAERYSQRYRHEACTISDAGLAALSGKPWKGNVRELQHVVERAVVLSSRTELGPDDFAEPAAPDGPTGEALSDVLEACTREHLVTILDRTGWRKGQAAEILGIDRVTLYRMLKKYSLEKS